MVTLLEKMELDLDFGKYMASIVTVTCIVLKRIRGRRICNPYALFEALKVRDFGSNRYNVSVTMMIAIRLFRDSLFYLYFLHGYRIENSIEVIHVYKACLSFHGIERTCSHCRFQNGFNTFAFCNRMR